MLERAGCVVYRCDASFLLQGGGGRMPNLCFWQVLLEEELQQLEQKRRDLKKDSLLELQHA